MTKREYDKCEKLMYEAIRNAEEAEHELELAVKKKNEIIRNHGFNHRGYAEGINKALVTIGFKHRGMEILNEKL